MNLRVIQVFFLLFTFYLKLFPMYVHIMSSLPFILRQKREESKMKVLRKFIAIFWPGYQIFSSTDMNFTSIALLLSLFIFKSTFNCKFAIIELVGDDDDHYGDDYDVAGCTTKTILNISHISKYIPSFSFSAFSALFSFDNKVLKWNFLCHCLHLISYHETHYDGNKRGNETCEFILVNRMEN